MYETNFFTTIFIVLCYITVLLSCIFFFNRHYGDRVDTVYQDVDSLVSMQLTSDVTYVH